MASAKDDSREPSSPRGPETSLANACNTVIRKFFMSAVRTGTLRAL